MEKLSRQVKYIAKYIYGSIPPRLRFHRTFWEMYNLLQKSQWWSRQELAAYQLKQLKKLLRHAYENVPYYKRIFTETGFDPYNFSDIKDLRKLPFLTKDIVRNNLKDLISENFPKSKIETVTTGGTTDVPLNFCQEKKISDSIEDAFIFSLWNRVGFKFGDKRVSIRGAVARTGRGKKFCEYDPIQKNLTLSSLDMTDASIQEYISTIREFQPDFFHVYPSVISILAKYMKKRNIKSFKNVKAILCCSEILYPYQRTLLEDVFQCRVYSWYGHAEKAVLAGECEESSDYHIFPEYGITELIDRDNNVISNADQEGEIVATGFNNYTLPFIRYRTGDLAIYSGKNCPCGRAYPLLERVTGREQEYFVDKNGSLVTFIWADKPLWAFKNKINAYQYTQDMPGKIFLKINANDLMKPSDLDKIKRDFLNLYKNFDITIRLGQDILRTRTGKIRYLIQNVQVEQDTGD